MFPTARPDLPDPAVTDPAGLTALLLLGDGRFPAGGHAHSAGVEAAVADGRIRDVGSLAEYVIGRLHTAALTEAALAAATVVNLEAVDESGNPANPTAVLTVLDAEAAARVTAPPLRAASRRLGRQLLRVASRCWPGPLIDDAVRLRPDGLHNPVALGLVGAVTGLSPWAVAGLSVHHAVTTPAQAAVRLLGLDPFEVAALTARADRDAAGVVASAVAAAYDATGDPRLLPAATAPLVEIAAVEHMAADLRLFAT